MSWSVRYPPGFQREALDADHPVTAELAEQLAVLARSGPASKYTVMRHELSYAQAPH